MSEYNRQLTWFWFWVNGFVSHMVFIIYLRLCQHWTSSIICFCLLIFHVILCRGLSYKHENLSNVKPLPYYHPIYQVEDNHHQCIHMFLVHNMQTGREIPINEENNNSNVCHNEMNKFENVFNLLSSVFKVTWQHMWQIQLFSAMSITPCSSILRLYFICNKFMFFLLWC